MNLIDTKLPNGATILFFFQNSDTNGVVGAHVRTGEWATWEFYRGDLRSTSTGHYFDDFEKMAEDFLLRVGKMRHLNITIEEE